jgi:hypothetical protein
MGWHSGCGVRARLFFCALLVGIFGRPVWAQTFPTGGWLPLIQNGVALGDPLDGSSLFAAAIDLVGDSKGTPAGFVASDTGYLYFRLRVAGYPLRVGGRPGFLSDAWTCLLDIDQDPQTYELLTAVDGIASPNSVALLHNTATAKLDSIDDPAETVLTTYATATNAEDILAGSTLGGAQDYFVDWAVSWVDLAAAGFAKSSPFHLVCGTSTSENSLSGGDVLDNGLGTVSFSATAADAMVCGDAGCAYDAVFKDGFDVL